MLTIYLILVMPTQQSYAIRLARFHKLNGHNVLFTTGTDEHGLKVEKAAEKKECLQKIL